MKKLKILILSCLFLLPGCWWFNNDDDYEFEFDTIITDCPANLDGINTDRDDYNSDLPYRYNNEVIYFSSNHPSYGVNFDIVRKSLDITYHPKKNNTLNISYSVWDTPSTYERKLFLIVNTNFNEYGPFTLSRSKDWHYFFYANDEGGDLDIKYVYNYGQNYDTDQLFGPIEAAVLNSDYDDAYPTINSDTTRLLFCSNRENNQFDIYSAGLSKDTHLHDQLSSGSLIISKESVLSGNQNDKCPSVNKNLLVFASDREGGYGGFDLYYSLFADGEWSEPVNFGEKINSEYDEYRPISLQTSFLKEDLMIFSSNRPEGKGGYDLYCVNIGDMIENPYYMMD
jgi:hypothetical protein